MIHMILVFEILQCNQQLSIRPPSRLTCSGRSPSKPFLANCQMKNLNVYWLVRQSKSILDHTNSMCMHSAASTPSALETGKLSVHTAKQRQWAINFPQSTALCSIACHKGRDNVGCRSFWSYFVLRNCRP